MKLGDITDILDRRYRPETAEEWDNSGLILGDRDNETERVFISLDLNDKALERAVKCGAGLVITHHPFIFGSIKRITSDDHLGRRILKAAKEGIAVYSMHTNYDMLRMADINARDLGLRDIDVLSPVFEDDITYGFGKTGCPAEPVTLREFSETVKTACRLDAVRVYGDMSAVIKKAAVCSGSGRSFGEEAIKQGADVLVTGDMDYHTAQDLVMSGLNIIDGGHYGTEFVFIDDVYGEMKRLCPELICFKDEIEQPYSII